MLLADAEFLENSVKDHILDLFPKQARQLTK
jgi:hypothetical protein